MTATRGIEHPIDGDFTPVTLVDVLRWRACHEPNAVGYTFLSNGEDEEGALTYGELDRQARAIAIMLRSMGAAGQPVLLIYPTGLSYVAAFFGCLYAGSIAVGVYPPRPNRSLERLAVIAHDSQARIVLTLESLRCRVEPLAAGIGRLEAVQWMPTDRLDPSSSEEWIKAEIKAESLALLQYTSGSTARPRGTMVSHGNVLHNSRLIYEAFGHSRESLVVGWLPMTHDMGLIGNMVQPLYAGCPLIFMTPQAFLVKPVRWLEAITRYRATTSGAPNFAYDLCTDKIKPEQLSELDLSRWDLAYNGAEPVRYQTIDRFSSAFAPCGFRREAFYPCYGLAEATLMVTGGSKGTSLTARTVSARELEQNRAVAAHDNSENPRVITGCGRARLDQHVLIVDPQTFEACPESHIGEVWIAGPSVTLGYWNQPEQTKTVFYGLLKDNERAYLRTGDLGFMHLGELFITGRLKEIIIIGGANHFPVDIEATVEACHDAIRRNCVAAIAVDDKDGVEGLAIVAEIDRHRLGGTQRQGKVDRLGQEVTRAIKTAVSLHHDLSTVAVCLIRQSTIPKTTSGKIQRHLCRQHYLEGQLDLIYRMEQGGPS